MRRALIAVAVAVLLVTGGAAAQEPYPTRPVSIVVAFPPGGLADLTARPLASALERLLKQPVVVSNKPGAAGAVGNQFVATGEPDGYTLLMALVDVEYLAWAGLVAPKSTPPHVLQILGDAVRQAVKEPEVVSASQTLQTPIAYQDADEFNAWWRKDAEKLAAVIKRIGKVTEAK
jgi:tripartite-type tricarboxylate transporter receptor subunit TctC